MSDQKRSSHWTTPPGFKRTVFPIVAALTIAGLGAGANTWLVAGRETNLIGVVAEPAATVQGNNRERVEAESITLSPTGFEPKEITRFRGSFLLAASNRSGLENVVIRLDRVDGDRIHELRMSRSRRGWQRVVNLQPGQYILSEASHPDWICQINITAE